MTFLTEADLRQRFGLGTGCEIRLGPNERLTPAAAELARQRHIRVLSVATDGAVAVLDAKGEARKAGSPLRVETGQKPGRRCMLCHQQVDKKPEGLTHLDAETLVPKTHPRIALRGKLDAMIAAVVLVQTEFDAGGSLPARLKAWLGDLRSWLGYILRAEVTGEPLPELSMGELTLETIHAISHNPKKYVGHEHLVPDASHGPDVARLNWLRAMSREVELAAMQVFARPDLSVEREDLILALNRLSSAFYVLMLLTLSAQQGRDIEKVGV
jgi:ethanolamine utilization cobalamin adenosyltransferase